MIVVLPLSRTCKVFGVKKKRTDEYVYFDILGKICILFIQI